MIEWFIKNFTELTKDELYALLKMRMEIFILEQRSFYLDLDGQDQTAMHFLGMNQGNLVAYGRLSINSSQNSSLIRRVAVHKDFRKNQLGTVLMHKMLNYIDTHSHLQTIALDAQYHLQNFYEKFGFRVVGEPYDDGGVLHIKMTAPPLSR